MSANRVGSLTVVMAVVEAAAVVVTACAFVDVEVGQASLYCHCEHHMFAVD
jgi:hypothetical protein